MSGRSVPGDFNTVTLLGTCWEVVHGLPHGEIKGVTVLVNTGEAVLIPVIADSYPVDLKRGDRLWIRGTIHNERIGVKYLHYIRPVHFDVVHRAKAS